jgi:dihydrofolate reductase
MRKVVVYTLVSLDGVAEAPETFVLDFDSDMEANLAEVIATQDVVLLGRVMCDEWSNYWPSSNDQPFADFINGVHKYVATSTPLTTEWTNAEAIHGPIADFVRHLAAGEGGDIGVHGSISLVQSLLAAGLVDELHLVIAPSVVGNGRRLFAQELTGRRLQLLRSTGTQSGSLLAAYRVASE